VVPECDVCGDPSTQYCGDCKKINVFCIDCHASVHKKAANRSHTTVDIATHLASAAATLVSSLEATTAGASVTCCTKHGGKPLEIYCKTCDEVICLEGGTFEHDGHEKVPISEVVGGARDSILSGADDATAVQAVLSLASAEIALVKQQILTSADASKQGIADVAKVIRQTAVAVAENATAEVDAIAAEKLAALDAQVEAIERVAGHLTEVASIATKTVGLATAAQVMQRRTFFVASIQRACDHGIAITPLRHATLFARQGGKLNQLLAAVVAEAVVVSEDATNPAACTVAGEGTERATVGEEATFVLTAVGFQGTPRTTGGDVVEVTLVEQRGSGGGGAAVTGTVEDGRNGTYLCRITPTTADGDWRLVVKVGGAGIIGSPFSPTVRKSRDCCQSFSTWSDLVTQPVTLHAVLFDEPKFGTVADYRAFAVEKGKAILDVDFSVSVSFLLFMFTNLLVLI
jgi:hypothetical protein